MKNILLATGIFPPDIGGPASYGKILAEKLTKEHGVTLISYSTHKKEQFDKNLPFKVIRIWRKTPRLLRHFIYFMKVYFAVGKADAVYALNVASAGLPSFIAARLRKKRFFVKVVGDHAWETAVNKNKTILLIDDFQKAPKRGLIKIRSQLQSWVCRKADGVIVPSKYLEKMVHAWGVPSEKIHLVYNGVDFAGSGLTHEEARKKLGIPGSIILSVGRLVPWKGFRMLIKLMPRLLNINQFFRLIIVGAGPEHDKLQLMIRNLGLERKVYLVGKKSKEELSIYLASADMFVLNTGYEGFSHQILEAMSVSVPVITTNVGGNREVVVQGENGFMVKYNDEFNLIEAIKTLWQSPELRDKLIEGGKSTASHFNVETMYRETIAILNK